jgi:hypothetical protein
MVYNQYTKVKFAKIPIAKTRRKTLKTYRTVADNQRLARPAVISRLRANEANKKQESRFFIYSSSWLPASGPLRPQTALAHSKYMYTSAAAFGKTVFEHIYRR